MRVLVTGDRGYIGAVLVPMLLENSIDAVGLDTDFFQTILNASNISTTYTKITKDIREANENDLEGIDAVIHLCALSNDPMGDLHPRLTEEINFKSSVKLAKLAKKVGVKRFLFSSSCSIYGIANEDIVDEESGVSPLTAYAKSKIETEEALRKLADSDFCVGILRNSTVYGFSPKFRNDLIVNNLATSALAYNQIRILSDGTPWRPLIDVRDLSSIFIEFLTIDKDKINAKIINVGFNENNYQIKDLIVEIQNEVVGSRVVYTREHGKDTRSYKVSFNKFKKIFPNVKQEWDIKRSIQDLIGQLKKFNFSKRHFESGVFTRLVVLKQLMRTGKINAELFWIR